jgi:hypothetical protein
MKTSRNSRTKKVKLAHLALVVIILVSISGMATASADQYGSCFEGTQPSGAVYLICMPTGNWNGDLVVYAHGYVAFNEPVEIPEDQLVMPDGTYIPDLINRLGFAFATTSYRANGLIVGPAIEDLKDLVDIFHDQFDDTRRVYLVGVSEGGLNTAMAIEQESHIFNGGLATCGPIGDFRGQINYLGNVRVLFDYFFPDVIPEGPVKIPQGVIKNWDKLYEPAIEAALRARPHATKQLLETARVPVNLLQPEENIASLVNLLWYNVFATNNATEVLGGQPFDNQHTIYRGSDNDLRLNLLVERFTADPVALAAIEAGYQTSGDPKVPLVTLHTLKDPIVPYWHETLYNIKVSMNGDSELHTNRPALGYGHCNFKIRQVLVAFGTLVFQVAGAEPANLESVLSDFE